MSVGVGKPSRPEWHGIDAMRLHGRIAFYVGDASEYAEDMARGWWYWTSREDAGRYRGPFRSRRLAERDRAVFRPSASRVTTPGPTARGV